MARVVTKVQIFNDLVGAGMSREEAMELTESLLDRRDRP